MVATVRPRALGLALPFVESAGTWAGDYYCRTPSKAHGLYVENVHGLTLKNVAFEYETPRQPWFGECLVVDNRSTGVVGADTVRCL